MLLRPLERICIIMVLAMLAINVTLASWKDVSVSEELVIAAAIVAALALIIGLFFRTLKKDDTLSLLFLNTGILFLFTFSAALYSHLLPPFGNGTIDAKLVEMDSWIGFHWPDIMAWAAQNPGPSELMRMAYDASTWLVLATFVLIALHTDHARAYSFMLAIFISAFTTITIWALFPSAGASAYWSLAPEFEKAVNPIVGTDYGQQLLAWYQNGIGDIHKLEKKGLVGFPSYHTVMTLICVYGLWGYWKSLAIASPIILMTIPAIFVHGGHNFVDFLAGAAITIGAVYAAQMICRWSNKSMQDLPKPIPEAPQQNT